MKKQFLYFILVLFGHLIFGQNLKFPYQKMGLTHEQAAAHLLSRFTFGIQPNQVHEVAKMGLENWFAKQLQADLNDDEVNSRLSRFNALEMDNETIANTFPRPGKIANMLGKNLNASDSTSKKEIREMAKQYLKDNGMLPIQDLVRQTVAQKFVHAIYGNNQLEEVMTDFWFNHFNVSLTKNQTMQFVYTFERDAIRPNAMGNFLSLLTATAKNPAMSLYLDNTTSVSSNNPMYREPKNPKKKMEGLNENYARELMELHTLGVDGGYTQNDVTEVARILTGWTIFPYEKDSPQRKLVDQFKNVNLVDRGFIIEKNFIFRANKHDQGEKTILGQKFPANHGYDEGLRVLKMLSENPSTAKFISKKIATRFVSDNPPQSLVDKMVNTFLNSNGDIKQILATMVNSEEFWSKDALREKIKSPFELITSTMRATNADVQAPYALFNWATKMGQKIYYYQAPTGFPDRAQYWINSGALLNRMNFGLAFATGKILGVKADLLALNNNHEAESANSALETYSKILLPERDTKTTIEKLKPLLNDPEIQQKIEKTAKGDELSEENAEIQMPRANRKFASMTQTQNPEMLSQVVGIIIGSPEFQRR